MKPKLIILCGPTGVGKSEIALRLAAEIGGEIIVADSQAVLKGFDIGTAKPTGEDREKIPHHLIDVAEFGKKFDAATFAFLAEKAIQEIHSRGKQVIVSGGTGLYLKALLFGLMEAPERNEAFRKNLENRMKEEGVHRLHEELKSLDEKRAGEIHPNDSVRIIRALEIYHLTGTTPSELSGAHGFKKPRYEALKLGLKRPQEELAQRINGRVLAMLNHGWVEEVKRLMEEGVDLIHGRTQTIGYPILAQYVQGEIFIKEAIEEIQKETRQLAKRQMTWFRADPEIQWYHPDQWGEMKEAVLKFLSKI